MNNSLHEDNAMNENAETTRPRRNFLSTITIAGAATVLALLAKKSSTPPAATPAAPDEELAAVPGTYHETEHIRKYYRSAARL